MRNFDAASRLQRNATHPAQRRTHRGLAACFRLEQPRVNRRRIENIYRTYAPRARPQKCDFNLNSGDRRGGSAPLPENGSSTKEHRGARRDQPPEESHGISPVARRAARQFYIRLSVLCFGPHFNRRHIALISGPIGGNPKSWLELQKHARATARRDDPTRS